MNKRKILFAMLILLLILVVVTGYFQLMQYEQGKEKTSNAITGYIADNDSTLTIMNWNIQTFGIAKWNRTDIREKILDVISRADIIFVQEIRDKSGQAFIDLCNSINKTFNCNISSRAGRTSSKEQYGIIYKKEIEIINISDYNPDEKDRWERPPVIVAFKTGNYYFYAINIHAKPEDAVNEIKELQPVFMVYSNKANTILLGDLNADCSYYDEKNKTAFLSEQWIIQDYDDTTATNSTCAYDRIIINNNMQKEFISYGIYRNTTTDVSDHYPAWIEIMPIN